MIRRSALALYLAASLGFAGISASSALSKTPDQAKLTIGSIGLNPTGDGYYNANVNLTLQRANNPQVNFNIFFQHVKSLDELYVKLRPAVDDLADELKHAEIIIPH
ncbi:MAG TPA: hypothetical protein VEK73_14345 [Xanthobacteraceae bacterium]|nr:hypothetical protein [Xanthobacteraceae bacterium]